MRTPWWAAAFAALAILASGCHNGGHDQNSRMIENPPDSIIEGETVSVVERQNTNQQGGAAAPQPMGEQKK